MLAAVLAAGALATSAQGITITSSDSGVVFQDTFENDTAGQLPTISGSDVGSGYTRVDGGAQGLVDIENDPAGELGKVLNLGNDAVANGMISLDFPAQPEGSVLVARFRAKVGDNGSLLVGFTHTTCGGGPPPCDDSGDYVTLCGQWVGLSGSGGDVKARWIDCTGYYGPSMTWHDFTAGGSPFVVAGGADQWIEVTLTQGNADGEYPRFTINGTLLDRPGFGISPYDPINGLRIRQNTGWGQSYVAPPAPPPTVSGLTITSSGAVVFREAFSDDVLGALPTIGGDDVGTGYTKMDAGVVGLTDIENDPSGQLGKVLNLANDGVANGSINLNFPVQPEGSVLAARFRAKVTVAGGAGSLGAGFTSGICGGGSLPCGDDGTDYVTPWGLYNLLVTGASLASPPPGIAADDVVLAYYDGNDYNVVGVGGDAEAGKVAGGAGQWIDVVLTLTAEDGAQPVFTLNGTVLDPIPYSISGTPAIGGLRLRHNGPPGSSFVAVEAPPPTAPGTVVIFEL